MTCDPACRHALAVPVRHVTDAQHRYTDCFDIPELQVAAVFMFFFVDGTLSRNADVFSFDLAAII